MDRRNGFQFDDATLLAYAEQTMTPREAAEFEAAAGADGRLLSSLRLMQADRKNLRALPEPQAPATLAADVLAQVERAMLLDIDLVAPPIDMRRYRTVHWQRYAAAAGFLLLLSGGGFMLLQSLRFDSRDADLAPDSLVRSPSEAASQRDRPGPVMPEEPAEVSPGPDLAVSNAGGIEEAALSARDFAALVDAMPLEVEPAVVAAIERHWPTDLGLSVNISADEPQSAFEAIARRLRAAGGDLIVNASINPPSLLPDGGRPWPGFADIVRPTSAPTMPPSGEAARPADPGAAPVPDDRVPLLDQSRSHANGFQFTILGTPSDILNVLREVNADRTMRLTWSRAGSARMLVDLVAPNLPPEVQWDRVMFWWVEPDARFDEARLLVAQVSTEPCVRIPMRIIPSSRRR